jgi:hypothetical protein
VRDVPSKFRLEVLIPKDYLAFIHINREPVEPPRRIFQQEPLQLSRDYFGLSRYRAAEGYSQGVEVYSFGALGNVLMGQHCCLQNRMTL